MKVFDAVAVHRCQAVVHLQGKSRFIRYCLAGLFHSIALRADSRRKNQRRWQWTARCTAPLLLLPKSCAAGKR
jgi:hypothetical protein